MSRENKPPPNQDSRPNFPLFFCAYPKSLMLFRQALTCHQTSYERVRVGQKLQTQALVIPPQQLRVGRMDDGPAPTGAAVRSQYKALYPASWGDTPTADTARYLRQKLASDHAPSSTNSAQVSIGIDVLQHIMEQMIATTVHDFPMIHTRAETEGDFKFRRWGMYATWMTRLVSKTFYLVLLTHWPRLVEMFYQKFHAHLASRRDQYMFDEALTYMDPWLYNNFREFLRSNEEAHIVSELSLLVKKTVNIQMRLCLKQLSDGYLQHLETAPYTIVFTGPSIATKDNKVELIPPTLLEFAEYVGGTHFACELKTRSRELILHTLLSAPNWDMLPIHTQHDPSGLAPQPKTLEGYLEMVRTRTAAQLNELSKSNAFQIRLETGPDFPVQMQSSAESITCISKWVHVTESNHHMIKVMTQADASENSSDECIACFVDILLPFRSCRKDWTTNDAIAQDPQQDVFTLTYTREMLEMGGGLPDGVDAYAVLTGSSSTRKLVEEQNVFVRAHLHTAWVLDVLHGEADRLIQVENMHDMEDGPLGMDLPDELVMATNHWHNSEFYDLRVHRTPLFLSQDTVFRASYIQYFLDHFPHVERDNPAHSFRNAGDIDFTSFLNANPDPNPHPNLAHMHNGFASVGWLVHTDSRVAELLLHIAENTPDIREYHIRALSTWAKTAPINATSYKFIYRDVIAWVAKNRGKSGKAGRVRAALNKIVTHWDERNFVRVCVQLE